MVHFIAEISSNHGQNLDRSLKLIGAAAKAAFDSVKFQLFRIAQLFAPEIEPAPAELPDRDWRADPPDGLRPLKQIRAGWAPV